MPHTVTVRVGEEASSIDLAVLMLHGYAMRPDDLSPFARSLGVDGRYVFPRGEWPAEGGGFGWWPIDGERRSASLALGPRDLSEEHPDHREAARRTLVTLLRGLREQGFRRVVLAGFSQGGMLACDTLLHEEVQVDGLALFSSSRIALDEWQPRRARLAGLPAMVAHGTEDKDLAFAAGQGLHAFLQSAGARSQWVPFEGGHEIPLPVWREFRKFLRGLASASADGGKPPVQAPCE